MSIHLLMTGALGAASAPPGGGSPAVETTTTGENNTSGTSNAITMPSGVTTGDLLVVLYGWYTTTDDTASIGAGTGWTIQGEGWRSSTTNCVIMTKVADGSDSLTIGHGISGRASWCVYRISNASTVTFGTFVGAATATPDPPSLDAGSSAERLWIAGVACNSNTSGPRTVGTYPTNYTNGIATAPNSTVNVLVGMASRLLTAQTEDPDTFTLTPVGGNTTCFTMAVE